MARQHNTVKTSKQAKKKTKINKVNLYNAFKCIDLAKELLAHTRDCLRDEFGCKSILFNKVARLHVDVESASFYLNDVLLGKSNIV